MKATRRQKARRDRPFTFTAEGQESWFYLLDGTASFHQPTPAGQHNVHGLRISRLIKALKACGYIVLFLLLPIGVQAKEVTMPYEDFLQIIAKVEHSEKLRNKAMAENGVLVKLNGEKDTIIKLQADQIQACEAIVQQQEQLGATQEQINQAVDRKLAELTKDLAREKRLSRYKSEFVGIGAVILGILWVVN